MKRFKSVILAVVVLIVLGTVIALAAKPLLAGTNGAKQIGLSIIGNKASCSATVSFSGKDIEADLKLCKGDAVIASWHKSGRNVVSFSEMAELKESGQYTLTLSGTAGGISFTSQSTSKTTEGITPKEEEQEPPKDKTEPPANNTEPPKDSTDPPVGNTPAKEDKTASAGNNGKSQGASGNSRQGNGSTNSSANTPAADPKNTETEKQEEKPADEQPAEPAEEKPAVEMRPAVNYPVIRVRNPYRGVKGVTRDTAIVINSKEFLDEQCLFPEGTAEDDPMYGDSVKLLKKYDDDWFKTHQILAYSLYNQNGPGFTKRVVRVSGAPENIIEIDKYYTGDGIVTTNFSFDLFFIELDKVYEENAHVRTIVNEPLYVGETW